jgi:hypothetical protein
VRKAPQHDVITQKVEAVVFSKILFYTKHEARSPSSTNLKPTSIKHYLTNRGHFTNQYIKHNLTKVLLELRKETEVVKVNDIDFLVKQSKQQAGLLVQ